MMGQCIYVAEGWRRHQGRPVVREMRSEDWMDPALAGRTLAEDQLLNTSVGVWLYEADVWEKAKLRERLLALVDFVTSPEFLPEYEAWGRDQLVAFEARQKAGPSIRVRRRKKKKDL